ncbi:MAG: RnfABCDGE type electron transport complex subunit D [Oscillospiraceae bacterium]
MSKTVQERAEGQLANKDFALMCIPLVIMAVFYYGPRALGMVLVALITAYITGRFAAMLMGKKYDKLENSSTITALLIVLMMPVTVKFLIVIVAVMVGILIGKEAFGGAKSYPFLPAAVGFCIAVVAWPQEVFSYPEPQNWIVNANWSWDYFVKLWTYSGITASETPAYVLQHGGIPQTDIWNILLGNVPGAMGVGAAAVIMACGVFLLVRKNVSFAASFSFLGTSALIAFLLPRAPDGAWMVLPWLNWQTRLQVLQYEMLSGAMMFAAVFLVNDPYILPKTVRSRIIYGVLLGIASMMFRYFGTFEMGICFAFLLVNAISGYFDRLFAKRAPKVKGETKA